MTIILENVQIFDGVNEKITCPSSVVIVDSRIESISLNKEVVKHSEAVRINCGGKFLMPGLIDAHIHAYAPTFSFYNNDRMPSALLANHAAAVLEGMLLRGFTTVRDAGGGDIGLAQAIEQGLIQGPRFFYSGKALSQTGGHGDMRPSDQMEPCGCGGYSGSVSMVADGVDSVRTAVREELRKGAHQIKLFVSGGVSSPNDPIWMNQFTEEEIRAAVYEAATRRTYVMAHCHTDEAAKRCVEYGVRSIEHGTDISPATAKLMAEHDVFMVPTLSVVSIVTAHGAELAMPSSSISKIAGLYEQMLQSIQTCVDAGVKIGLGSDILSHEFHPLQGGELALRGAVSSPIDVLRSATSVNAELVQKAGELGCIAPGACADILVLDFDPLLDLSPFKDPGKNIPLIMLDGKIIKNELSLSGDASEGPLFRD